MSAKYYCDFCGRIQDEVKTVVVGPKNICICSECVMLAYKIVIEKEETGEGA